MAEIGDKIRPVVEPLLDDGETLEGVCVGSRQGFMSGKFVVIAATDRRLIILETTRKLEPKGEPLSLPPATIASASIDGASALSTGLDAAIMNKTSLAVKLRTTEGEKVKLMPARGEGPLSGLMGGETQRQGAESLRDWLVRHEKV